MIQSRKQIGDKAITANNGHPNVLKNVSHTFNTIRTRAYINLDVGRRAFAPIAAAAGATTKLAPFFIPTIMNDVTIDFVELDKGITPDSTNTNNTFGIRPKIKQPMIHKISLKNPFHDASWQALRTPLDEVSLHKDLK